MQCKKCGMQFSRRHVVDGKVHNLCSRKYCLTCSPFGVHNTRNLECQERKSRVCQECGVEMRRRESGKKCWTCTNKHQRQKKIALIQGMVGTACWECGYDKCWSALDFHHVDPSSKKFNITTRELQYRWDVVRKEVVKCVLLCCRCHRELHAGLLNTDALYSKFLRRYPATQTDTPGPVAQ